MVKEKVLVTGGTGFTGKALVKRLIDEGFDVTALDCRAGHKTDEIKQWGAKLVMGSVTDFPLMQQLTKDTDVVFHVAAAFRELNVSNQVYRDVNVNGTKNVLEASLQNKVKKFVYCSTCGVHGNVENPPGDESAPIEPADYYQQSKYDGEVIVEDFVKKGLKATILRPAAIYGPGDPGRYLMIFKRVKKGLFPIFGNGKTLYHPVYIDNLIDAFILASKEDVGNGEAYLIADENFVEIKDLVNQVGNSLGVDVKTPHLPLLPLILLGHICEKVCKPFHITPPIFPRRVDWFRQNRAFNIDKAKRELGYSPKVDLNIGLKKTADWYKKEGLI